MNDPKYDVSISYVYPYTYGKGAVSNGGVTYSVDLTTGGWYLATMRNTTLSATAADYRSALNSLLILATASTTPDPNVMPYKNTF